MANWTPSSGNWYWSVQDSSPGSQVWKGSTGAFVAFSDSDYVAFLAASNVATSIDTAANLYAYINTVNKGLAPTATTTQVAMSSANAVLTNPVSQYIRVVYSGGASGHSLVLPAMNVFGSPAIASPFVVLNDGTSAQSLQILLQDGSTPVTTLAPGEIAQLVLVDNTSANGSIFAYFPPPYLAESGNVANYLVKRDGSGNFSAGTITAALTGTASGNLVSGGSIGAATATALTVTTINKVTITQPASGSTLTIADGKTATVSNTLTLAGTDASTLNVGVGGTLTGSSSAAIWYDNIPQNSKSAAYTTVLADAQKHILHPSADTTARTFTIDSNANVAYPIGTSITFVNQHSAGVVTISITTDTMRLAGAGTTGSRTLAADGMATALKITSTEWIISGTGLT